MIDLNLVRVLIAIHETGSVSGAAERLHVTQPSVSHALARLRDILGDPLFKRTREGMEPTFFSTQMYQIFRPALDSIEAAIVTRRHFDPQTSNRTFRVALSDLGEMTFLRHLIPLLHCSAPGISVEIVSLNLAEIDEWFASGRIDLAVGRYVPTDVRSRSEFLFREHYVCLMSASHPRIAETLTMESYLKEGHIVVDAQAGHWQGHDSLAAEGKDRRVVLSVPHFIGLQDLVADSELLAIVPSRTGRSFSSRGTVKALNLPFPGPDFEVRIYWRDNLGDQEAMEWLRHITRTALCTI
ncbi:LysR family transcriptional regulator [Agrobacterium tumefaciens]|uniref:Transcriptional regulator n=1 Tax=Agrobacterium tumefaciens str. Kerr 14 TaxID=1183424 RepID=A0A1S7P8G9_AGRTU|nr:LysR family transcriptional regulator [Agrobacterium tumefaciens]AYM82111.1 LysR family transcriptional regulator, nod-box dependent transcriptional activator [Agrobacterium tumefaciens]NTE92778.1 LysR family transcriptional regulator [Agrobacterium tumefaciens]CUX17380.1 Transcriptional regulator [Agrobacterium tumefaciens str. Kerr 14]